MNLHRKKPGHFKTELPRKKDIAILNDLDFSIAESSSNSWTFNQKDSEFLKCVYKTNRRIGPRSREEITGQQVEETCYGGPLPADLPYKSLRKLLQIKEKQL